ncbi:hypothetical protein [Nakamurella sp.]|uniref:hypothetical protein n=1 Tax=Nakamurella sp. TaxID=1869182 RepID=UPI003784C970
MSNIETQVRTTETGQSGMRLLAVLGMAGALAQVGGGLLETVDRVGPGEPGYALRTSAIGVAYLLFLATLVGVERSGATAHRRLSRVGLTVAGVGWVLYSVAQFVLQVDPRPAETVLFPVGTVLIGIGMIAAGVGVLRAHRWTGWRRYTVLACGVYPFAILFPTFAITGGPNFLALALWGVCWFVSALALWPAAERS